MNTEWLSLTNRKLWVGIAAILVVLAFSAKYFGDDVEDDYSFGAIDRVVMELEAKYKRDYSYNDFSLHYQAKRPNGITLQVTYTDQTKMDQMNRVVEAAQEFVRSYAKKTAKIDNLQIDVVREKVDAP